MRKTIVQSCSEAVASACKLHLPLQAQQRQHRQVGQLLLQALLLLCSPPARQVLLLAQKHPTAQAAL